MTQKEKARAYDEALERARKLYNSEETSADVEIACETIFPELAESEDERIRKDIISYIKVANQYLPQFQIGKWISWLEKQNPVKVNEKDERISKDIAWCIKHSGIENHKPINRHVTTTVKEALAWLEKQGEQKQEENDQKCEPFRIKKGEWYVCIHDFCNKAIRIGEIIQAEHDDTIRGIGFLYMENKYFRPAFENEIPQKSKWTDEDEERLQSCIIELQGKGLMGGVDTIDTKWLKSLKQRMEEQQWQRK